MENLATLYANHIAELQKRAKNALARENLDALVIHSGQELKAFLDDYTYAFKVNPHFKHWLPILDVANCWLMINGVDKPTLIYYQPDDFWHQIMPIDNQFWLPFFDVKILTKSTDVDKLLVYDKKGLAYLGEHIEVAKALGFSHINPEPILNYLHYHRAYKTPYEQECIRQANQIALVGHLAAKKGFYTGESEFVIAQDYLTAISQTDNQTPYRNIIALNEHAAILHYGHLSTARPKQRLSFLIDAGASFHGYAADISRTYAFEHNAFEELIVAMNSLMLGLVDLVKPGLNYLELHHSACLQIGALLKDLALVNVDAQTALNAGIVATFFPHGLGHHLGLQTHDVGGFMADERGTHIAPPKEFPFLRNTRTIETNQVFTIEPGLYFIKPLLAKLKASRYQAMVNWHVVEKLIPYGGIRIEDNIIVHQLRNENITREMGLN